MKNYFTQLLHMGPPFHFAVFSVTIHMRTCAHTHTLMISLQIYTETEHVEWHNQNLLSLLSKFHIDVAPPLMSNVGF